MVQVIRDSPYSQIFFFDDFMSSNHFLKHFFGGMFITLGMTGLDQDMMQKNLSCRNTKDAQKNMIVLGVVLVVVNVIFLALGALLYLYAGANEISVENSDLSESELLQEVQRLQGQSKVKSYDLVQSLIQHVMQLNEAEIMSILESKFSAVGLEELY